MTDSNQEPMMSGAEFQRRRVLRAGEEQRTSAEWAERMARGDHRATSTAPEATEPAEGESPLGVVPGFDDAAGPQAGDPAGDGVSAGSGQQPDARAGERAGGTERPGHAGDRLVAGHDVPQQPETAAGGPAPMTAQDFLARRHGADGPGPATWGWRGWVRRVTRGAIQPRMGKAELEHVRARQSVQRSFSGPRTIVFVNPKGGGVKTTSTLMAGKTFGTIRGGSVVAWDNNETRGTLGMRSEGANHANTTRELLDDVEEFRDVMRARVGDLAAFVRRQGDAHFDVLASDERPEVTGQISAEDFTAVHEVLQRFYGLILIDTGNNLRAENWLAAAETADLIVLTSSMKEDVGYSGLWALDALENSGYPNLRERVVTVLSQTESADARLSQDLIEAFASRTRAVFTIPYDPGLQPGSQIRYDRLSSSTNSAWLQACAEMARAL